jgi:hypothetical protein
LVFDLQKEVMNELAEASITRGCAVPITGLQKKIFYTQGKFFWAEKIISSHTFNPAKRENVNWWRWGGGLKCFDKAKC